MCDQVKEVGIILGHGNDWNDCKGKLLTDLAIILAKSGTQGTAGNLKESKKSGIGKQQPGGCTRKQQ
jgi:hypothetical protein